MWSNLRRGVLLTLLLALIGPVPVQAQSESRCFRETGYCIRGAVRDYWERNGGLPIFGYPLTTLREETVEGRVLPVQWFERDRLEIQADGTVTAGRLGVRYLELAGRPWVRGELRQPQPDCRWFKPTGYAVCGAILAHWETNGGLERFGYPITELITEEIEGRLHEVQYFERRRAEIHPDGVSQRVLLGRLGAELQTLDGGCVPWFFNPSPTLCPQGAPTYAAGAAQRFERGVMIWRAEPDSFTIVHEDGRYWIARSPYRFVDAPDIPAAPPGRYAPTSGFGDVWRGRIAVDGPTPPDEPLSALLGWAVAPEQGMVVATQCQRARAPAEQRCYLGNSVGPIVYYGPGGGGRVR